MSAWFQAMLVICIAALTIATFFQQQSINLLSERITTLQEAVLSPA